MRDKSIITYNPLIGNGKNLREFSVIGRNSIMYFIDGKDIYRIDIRTLINKNN